ncbi:MAG: hypothetical protein RL514_3810 [Verrucomicrobiota bacterium]|jgi:hypothetical protein
MAEKYQEDHQRGLQTDGVWGTHSPAFKAGKLTLAAHTADVGDILIKASLWEAAGSALETARDNRDTLDMDLKSLCVHGPDAIQGDLEEGDEILDDLPPIRGIRMTNPEQTLARARKLVPAWTKANARRLAAVPPDPELKAKGKTLAQTQTAMADLAAALQNVQNKLSDERKASGALDRAATKVEKGNKKWFVAWQGEFAVGSPERDALDQIDTNAAPAPVAVQIETVTPGAGGAFAVDYTAGGGAHASALLLQWQVVGVDADYTHAVALNQAGQTVATGAATGATVKFRTKAMNSAGVTYSTVETATAV